MISDNELVGIVHGLLEKMAKEKVGWQQKKIVPPKEGGAEAYQLNLPESVIEIQHVSPRAAPDYITFELRRRSDGQGVGHRQVYDGDVSWDPLFDLYARVSREALGLDNVLKDVQSFLGIPSIQPASR